MRTIWPFFAALAAGAMLPLQAGINARLGREVASPVLAALISFAVGTLALLLYALGTRAALPAGADLSGKPPWIWIGGALGAVFVTAMALLAPRLGVGTLTALVIAGQMAAAILLDHWGLLGLPRHPVSLWRLAGAALLVLGVLLVRRY